MNQSSKLAEKMESLLFFLRNEKKNEAPAGGTWSGYPGIRDTKTLRDQAEKYDRAGQGPPPPPPSENIKGSRDAAAHSLLVLPFLMP